MKRIGHITNQSGERVTLVEAMADYANVQKAYNKARKCKRYRKDVLLFTKDKEDNLETVRNDILGLSYEPSEYRYFKVYEPKERQIMALPFYDRVVQHTINNVLEPIFNQRFIFHSYACRKTKGMHAAYDTLQEWLYEWQKFHPDQPLYAIKADIHHYFQSINHDVLKAEIRKVIKDAGALVLIDRIIDHNGQMPDGVGIPVGNLTSQLFANIYLNKLDQYIKHTLGAKHYMRYMDDFILLSPDKEQLRRWLADIERFLRDELKLELNPKTTILAAKNGIDFVGYKHRATHRKVRPDSVKRIKKTIKKYESGKITKEQLQKSIASWTGHTGHADSYNLQKKVIALADAAIQRVETQKAA
ncbi:MAG: reverse transcriptase domain-containing protein [Lachnospiraceae bacterium]|jgi:RNA-directed DNA polymerase